MGIIAGRPVTAGLLAELFLWRLVISVALAIALGWATGWLAFRAPVLRLAETHAGPVAVGVTLAAYAAVQLAGGYGFVAVFVTAVTLRARCRDSRFHAAMARFAEEIEHMVVLLLLLLFGGALADGLLDRLTEADAALGLALIFVVRPLAGWIGLIGSAAPAPARLGLAFFGVRGVGTLFYLLYALRRSIPQGERIASLVGFVVLLSIVVHGVAATPAMRRLDGLRRRRETPA